MRFNPFNKSLLQTLTEEDLQQLIEQKVAEGYFVEYKSDFAKKEKISRSLASFANTYGGWYFVGIEADRQNNVATSICGFALDEHPDPIAEIRNIVRDYISPSPVYYAQVIPLLAQDRAVLAVNIPDEQETPFICKDGRLYRRLSDSSDPIPENDRHSLDRLVDQGQNVVRRFDVFCADERTFSKVEENSPWLRVFISPYPLGTIERTNIFHKNYIRQMLASTRSIQLTFPWLNEPITCGLPCNSGQATHRSIILRQNDPSTVAFANPTIELFVDGRARFFVPIEVFSATPESLRSLATREQIQSYRKQDRIHFDLLRFFKINRLRAALCAFTAHYINWLQGDLKGLSFRVAVTLDNVWRTVPLIDSDEWGEYISEFGLPVMHSDSLQFPIDKSGGAIIEHEEAYPLWLRFSHALNAMFGLPQGLSIQISSGDQDD